MRWRRSGPSTAVLAALLVVLLGSLLAACGADEAGDTTDASTPTSAVFDPDAGDPDLPDPGDAPEGATDLADPYTPGAGNEGVDVQHHALDLTWDPDDQELAGTATVTLRLDDPQDAFSLDLATSMAVESVAVDGEEAEHEQGGNELVITPAATLATGADVEVVVEYAGTPGPIAAEPSLGEIGWLGDGDVAYVAAQPYGAFSWFPTNDHPSDKATYDLRFTVPSGLAAASNGDLVSHDDDGEQATWVWAVEQPMASYLATVALGELELVETTGPGGLPLTSFYPADEAEIADDFAGMGEQVAVLSELFGPYPFGSFGAIVVPDELGFALETQNRPLYGTDALTEDFQVHELAHQWFGDSVTPLRWEDIWLNEGFATYAEWLWSEQTDPGFDIDARAAQVAEEPETAEGPIYDPGIDDLFAFSVYDRGAATVHALRRELGDDVFFPVVQAWLAEHAGQSVTTRDFTAFVEAEAGRNLTPFFNRWLRKEPFPA